MLIQNEKAKPKKTKHLNNEHGKKNTHRKMEISNGTWEKVLSIFWEASKMYSVFLGPIVKNKKYRRKNKNKIIQQHQNLKEMKKCIKPNIRYSEFVAEVEHRPEFQWNDTMNHLHIFAICLKRFILCQYWWAKQIKSERNETKRYTNDHGASVIHCQRHLVVWMGALLPRDTHF